MLLTYAIAIKPPTNPTRRCRVSSHSEKYKNAQDLINVRVLRDKKNRTAASGIGCWHMPTRAKRWDILLIS